ncbi:DUF488 domain-containing protein [Peterkaempfera bronchialis]|uniref:DUF488 family protein n=1 Tax=Peterkaempfera bronchialis TaxID=2126346 RepID=A0A345SZ94_9ACTN|nr:DUF488 family protein [Peterkaempfera bronchialis]AXI79049.1 DUF488 family protein [Peterkaempfera bronchialis]
MTKNSTKTITCRRIYEEASPRDGVRVLVDRIWPRGVRKEDAHLDEWLQDVAPSTDLRHWFAHRPERFSEFRRRYQNELQNPERQQAVAHLREIAEHDGLTLLTATRDVEHSQAAVLALVLTDVD